MQPEGHNQSYCHVCDRPYACLEYNVLCHRDYKIHYKKQQVDNEIPEHIYNY